MIRKMAFSGAHWWMLLITVGLFVLVAALVDLRPAVDERFFFSSRDTAAEQSGKIDKHFSKAPGLILAISSRDISSAQYLSRIDRLTREVRSIDEVTSVKSCRGGSRSLSPPAWSPVFSGSTCFSSASRGSSRALSAALLP
jgi:predicted RND superfamily exporter protein